MEQQPKVRCKLADSFECFIASSISGGCCHITEHYKDDECDIDFCLKLKKHNVYCEQVKGKEQ